MTPQHLLARLDQRIVALKGGTRDADARQQSLYETIHWSYMLLNADERHLFGQMSVFHDGCTLEALEALSQALHEERADVVDHSVSLVNKSLVQREETADGEIRLTMLETIRAFAAECLERSGEAHATWRAADYRKTWFLRNSAESKCGILKC